MNKRNRYFLVIALSVFVIIVVSFIFFRCSYYGIAECMGFSEFTSPALGTNQIYYRGKTTWDILELLIVPVALAIVAIWFESSERKQERINIENRIQEDTLRQYFDKMEQYFLEYDLRNNIHDDESEIFKLVNVYTVTTLRRLDRERRNIVFQFIRDAYIERFVLRRAYMENIDLSGSNLYMLNLWLSKLRNANLSFTRIDGTIINGSDLAGCNFTGATIWDVTFEDMDLSKVKFDKAQLDGVDFKNTNLSEASFVDANLKMINIATSKLDKANFTGAILREVNFTPEQLATLKLTKEQRDSAKLSVQRHSW